MPPFIAATAKPIRRVEEVTWAGAGVGVGVGVGVGLGIGLGVGLDVRGRVRGRDLRRGGHRPLGRDELRLVPLERVVLEPERGDGAQSRQDLRGDAPRARVRVGQRLGALVQAAEQVVPG